MSETLATYTLEIRGRANEDGSLPEIKLLPGLIRETEENLTDLLKNGFLRYDLYVLIKEWDSE